MWLIYWLGKAEKKANIVKVSIQNKNLEFYMSSSLDHAYIFRFRGVQLSDRRGAEESIRKLFTKIGKYILYILRPNHLIWNTHPGPILGIRDICFKYSTIKMLRLIAI